MGEMHTDGILVVDDTVIFFDSWTDSGTSNDYSILSFVADVF